MIKAKNPKTFIAEAVTSYLKTHDDPPAVDYVVDKRTIKTDKADPSFFNAAVTVVTDWVQTKKSHIRVRFQYDYNKNQLEPETLTYI